MAAQGEGIDITLPAAADLSSYQFRFITVDANGRGTLSGANSVITGILQNKPSAANAAARVRVAGESKLVFGAAVNENSYLASGVEGCGTAAASLADEVGALALVASGGSGDIMNVLVTRMHY